MKNVQITLSKDDALTLRLWLFNQQQQLFQVVESTKNAEVKEISKQEIILAHRLMNELYQVCDDEDHYDPISQKQIKKYEKWVQSL